MSRPTRQTSNLRWSNNIYCNLPCGSATWHGRDASVVHHRGSVSASGRSQTPGIKMTPRPGSAGAIGINRISIFSLTRITMKSNNKGKGANSGLDWTDEELLEWRARQRPSPGKVSGTMRLAAHPPKRPLGAELGHSGRNAHGLAVGILDEWNLGLLAHTYLTAFGALF